MGSHPLNLLIRFLLEICVLVIGSTWGWKQSDGWLRVVLAIGIPVFLSVIWGVFNVPGDPSRSGAAPIITPGIIRLGIEIAIFSFGIWCLYDMGSMKLSLTLSIIVFLHYAVSYDRISWLISQ